MTCHSSDGMQAQLHTTIHAAVGNKLQTFELRRRRAPCEHVSQADWTPDWPGPRCSSGALSHRTLTPPCSPCLPCPSVHLIARLMGPEGNNPRQRERRERGESKPRSIAVSRLAGLTQNKLLHAARPRSLSRQSRRHPPGCTSLAPGQPGLAAKAGARSPLAVSRESRSGQTPEQSRTPKPVQTYRFCVSAPGRPPGRRNPALGACLCGCSSSLLGWRTPEAQVQPPSANLETRRETSRRISPSPSWSFSNTSSPPD